MRSLLALPLLVAQLAAPSPAPLPALPLHLRIDAATLAGLPRTTVEATDEQGKSARYSGVSLRAALTKAGVPSGAPVRGKIMDLIVVVDATDGYRVPFALAELDPSYTDRIVLLADQRDGTPLPAREGPYRLIVPGEKREGRWERNVTEVDVEAAP